jgi:hypothetical protein
MSVAGDDQTQGARAGQPKTGRDTFEQPSTSAIVPAGKHESFGEDMSSVNAVVQQIKAQVQAGPTQPKK